MPSRGSEAIPLLYRGSVKDLRGPLSAGPHGEALAFEYTDAYSVFDWGRMPDALERKGEALAVIAAHWFERIEQPETWREFSRSPEALALRKGNRFGAAFNELGETLQRDGLRTHYLGLLEDLGGGASAGAPIRAGQASSPCRHLCVRPVSAVRPAPAQLLGRSVPDYLVTRASPPPRLVPLEVVFRFSCPAGSSLLDRVARDPGYLESIGFGGSGGPELMAGASWGFPVLELFTKLEATDRVLGLSEALAISGIPAAALESVLLRTAWIAGLLKSFCARAGIELADGKLEWGIDERGEVFLVDAIGPDELRLLKDGMQLSKEFLRTHYRGTAWYRALERAKSEARAQGIADWKRLVTETPAPLPAGHRELGSQLYQALANALAGRRWFPAAWPLDRVVSTMAEGSREGAPGKDPR